MAGRAAASGSGAPAASAGRAATATAGAVAASGSGGSTGLAGRAAAAAGSLAAGAGGGRSYEGAGAPAAGAGGAAAGSAAAEGGRSGSAGAASGGACDWSDPPANVAAWIDESWRAQLGPNIKNRKAWILDNVMLNKGEINVCVRWGATSAVPDQVRANLAPTVERWFNDWFKALGDYGCFPYGAGIKVKVTGWAVKPGQQALLGSVDPSVSVYTETDPEGEPKCPDACSSFVHWDHDFSRCPGGEEKHTDYWLWFNDRLPGGGGAAAVGGDWGLRMPVGSFISAFNKPSDHTIEHEMGHGFGFQDYYDWTGSRPAGGSIMIVGSTQSESPTTGDTWLLRRTWKEMTSMRGW